MIRGAMPATKGAHSRLRLLRLILHHLHFGPISVIHLKYTPVKYVSLIKYKNRTFIRCIIIDFALLQNKV